MKPNLEVLLQQIDSQELARRLVQARTARKLVQQQSAEALGMSRPTFINIEKGQRPISAHELLILSKLYDTDPYSLVALPPGDTDLIVQFRRTLQVQDLGLGQEQDELDMAIKTLQDMAIAYLELEQMVGKKHIFKVHTQYPLEGHRDLKKYAALIARQERQRLHLGDEPIPQLFSLLEEEYGVRVFRFSLPRGVSGFYGYASGLGGCIAINEDHPIERQLQTAAHETGHLLTSAHNVQIQVLTSRPHGNPAEQFAGAFGMNFTLPEAGVQKLVYDFLESNNDQPPSVRDLVAMAHQYSVSFEAFLRRLVDLEYLPHSEVKRLTSQKVVKKTKEALGLTTSGEPTYLDKILARYPERYKRYLVEAYEQDLLEPEEITTRYLKGINQGEIANVVARYTQVPHIREDGSLVNLDFEGYQERVNWRIH
ncbi:helix-turn-helix domain-containing protein [Deinococcus arboris]|nr:XRE family transcriptional regulator [Deinococcus arboris]